MSFRVWLGLEAGRRLGMGKVGRVFFRPRLLIAIERRGGGAMTSYAEWRKGERGGGGGKRAFRPFPCLPTTIKREERPGLGFCPPSLASPCLILAVLSLSLSFSLLCWLLSFAFLSSSPFSHFPSRRLRQLEAINYGHVPPPPPRGREEMLFCTLSPYLPAPLPLSSDEASERTSPHLSLCVDAMKSRFGK